MTAKKQGANISNCDDPASAVMAALLPLHTAGTLEWLSDATCTAAEYAVNASYAFLYFENEDGTLGRRLPASDLRRRSLQRAIDAFGEAVLSRRIDPKTAQAFGDALELRKPLIAPAAVLFAGLSDVDAARTAQEALGLAAAAIVPIESAGERVGLLVLLCAEQPSSERLHLLGQHVACAIVNVRHANAAREHGVIDVVRSVFDARKIESDLQKELTRAERYKHEVSIAVIEATNLRLLRDRFGQFLTDQLLQRLGGALAQNARDIDMIGAYKESGYTMILTQASADGAAMAAGRLLQIAQSTKLSADAVPGLELHLVCGWATSPADGTTTDSLFALAETRMYGAAGTRVA